MLILLIFSICMIIVFFLFARAMASSPPRPVRLDDLEIVDYRTSEDKKQDLVFENWTEFKSLKFGENPPSYKQFRYAIILGVKLPNGVTFSSISALIDQAKNNRKSSHSHKPKDSEIELIYNQLIDENSKEWGDEYQRRSDEEMRA